jgi:sec-independent protein translocase protein TatA
MHFNIWELLLILVIVLVLFGGSRLRNLGSDLGGAVKGFKDGMKEGSADKPAEPVPPQQVSGQTIDVEARREQNKS